ncbi:O-antigen ligase family protein [Enterobacter mori]
MLEKMRNVILFFIVLYPFLYFIPQIGDVFSHFFEIIYFLFIDVLILIYLSFYIQRLKLAGLSLLFTFVVWLCQFNNIADIRPYFFILTLWLISLFGAQRNGVFNDFTLKLYPFVFIVLSFISLFLPWSYIDDGARYKGFSLSPTHYSVYALCAVIFCLQCIRSKCVKAIYIILLVYFIYRSETRLALAVLVLIFVFYYFDRITLALRGFAAFTVIAMFSLSYLVYSLITKYTDIFTIRYAGGEDKSYEARTLIQGHVLDEWQNSSLSQYIFGHGAESARNMLIEIYGYDIMPHNDFLKLLYDFGFIGFIFFIFAIFKYGKNNLMTLSFLTVYISAFYHNMAYSLFAISMMIVLNSYKNNRS